MIPSSTDDRTRHAAGRRRRVLPLPLLVITSTGSRPGRGHLDVGLAAIDGGADGVQLRAGDLDDDEMLATAWALATACGHAGVPLIVNDRLDVALACGAAGVHLGQSDALDGARARLGPGRLLGVSVNTVAQAQVAEDLDADYLGVTVWATPTKPEAQPVSLEGLRRIVKATPLPVIAVGGIDADNAHQPLEAGAAGIAVVSAVGAAEDPIAATQELVSAVART